MISYIYIYITKNVKIMLETAVMRQVIIEVRPVDVYFKI